MLAEPYQNYYANYISSIWSFNGITIPEAGPMVPA
jgi:hypothetical protein